MKGRDGRLNTRIVLPIYVFLDLLCVAVGMGVPFFCILLGFPVGWYLARRIASTVEGAREVLARIMAYAVLTAGVTFVVMCAVWGPTIGMLFDPAADLGRFGIPMILYQPRASFIAWLALMILASPFLQLLTTVFASHLTLLECLKNEG